MALNALTDDSMNDVPVFGLGTNQELAVGAASVASATFAAGTKLIRVATTTACRILIGSNPTALASSPYLPANSVEFFKINPADGTQKLAVIQDAAGGKLTVTEMV